MSLGRTASVLAAALAIAGCGGDGESALETTQTRPTLSRAVADDLAARSDAVADALDAGDTCTAAHRADELLDAVLAAINEGRVPRQLQEDLTARANELVNTVNCPPPPPTTTEQEQDDDEGNGDKKKEEKEKNKDKDEDQGEGDGGEDGPVVTLPEIP